MVIIPAIDLIDGVCVRLTEGNFNKKKEYSKNPLEIAFRFKDMGAKRIHIVDLDGAKSGKSKNRDSIKKIKKETGLIVETGGGLRKEKDINELLEGDIDYLILGTIIVEDLKLVEKWIKNFGNKFIAGIDVKDNEIKTHGWLGGNGLNVVDFGKKIFNAGFETAVFTDISKDGKLEGPNFNATKEFVVNTGLKAILSGGITDINDIIKAKSFEKDGIIGAIVGKAFYEGKIDLKKAILEYQD